MFKSKLSACILFFIVVIGMMVPLREGCADLGISPAFLEVELDKGRPAGQFIISNLGDEEERYRIKAVHFSLSKTGGLDRIPPDGHSLAQWIKFNPTEFTLGPKTNRAVRFVIAPQGNLRAGEYWGAMELESLKTTMAKSQDQAGREFHIAISASIMVPIFGKSGNVRYLGTVKDAKMAVAESGKTIEVLFENTGDGRLLVEGQYEIRNSSGEEAAKGQLARTYVLPGMERVFTGEIKADLKEGNYKVQVKFTCPQLKQSIEKEYPLIVKPTM